MSLIQTLVRRELSNVFISIASMVLLYILTKFAVKSIEEFVIDNDKKHKAIDNKINGIDNAIFNVQRYLTSRDLYPDTSSESSDESSEDSESVPSMVSRDPYPNPEWVDRV